MICVVFLLLGLASLVMRNQMMSRTRTTIPWATCLWMVRLLLRSINRDREELRRTHGLFDTLPLIREFRDTGGR